MALIHNQDSDSGDFNSQPSLPAQLRILLEDGNHFEVSCYDRITIGRDLRENHEFVDLSGFDGAAQGIARRHLEILPVSGDLTVQDLYSVNGSWLNGEALTPGERYQLNHGDTLQLGDMIVVIQYDDMAIQH